MTDKSLFNRLKRLFSTNVIIRNVKGQQLKVTDTERIQSYSDLNTNFLKSRGLAGFHSTVGRYGYNELATISMQRLVLFRDYDLMESDPIIACLAEDTKVSTLKGFFTIKELSEMYPTDENFEIWSWDREECKYTIGQAHHPRKTGTKKIIKLVLDNGNFLKCTEDHRIMLIDGTYKEAGKLEIDDRIMPFYYKNKEYMMISDRHGKYKKAHRYIYEDVLNINVNGKHIHHINHNKYDNTISNLIDILPEDHMKYHELSDITSSKKEKSWNKEMRKNASNKMKKLWNIDEYKKLFLSGFKEFQTRYDYKELMSNYMKDRWKNSDKIEKNEMLKGFKDWQNSDEGKKFMSDHTSKLNKKRWKTDIKYIKKMAKLSSDRMKNLWKNKEWAEYKRKLHSETIKLKYANNPEYVNMIKRIDTNNGRFNSDITNEYILSEAYKYKTLSEFSNTLNLSCKNKNQFVNRRLKSLGYNSFNDYKSKYVYQNHKIVNIIDENEIVDVYDLTVDFYENFALECGIIVSNSALDVYADECVGPDTIIPLLDGRKLSIKELYELNETKFWVYSLDQKNQTFVPAQCEYVKYNGKKKMYDIEFDDGTIVKASENHLWASYNTLIYTSDLKIGDSIVAFPTKLSDSNFMSGYEMLLENGKWKYTHRLVAQNIDDLLEEKMEKKKVSNNLVLHHSSFDKKNNSPDKLTWLEYIEHRKIHAQYNKKLWSDPIMALEYKNKIREFHKKYWTKELRENVSKRQKSFMNSYMSILTDKDKKEKYGRNLEKNGMFNNGHKLIGNKNGRYIENVNRIENINIDDYICKIKEGYNRKQLCEYFNILHRDMQKLNIKICTMYGYKSIKEFNPKVKNITIPILKNELNLLFKKVKNPLRNIKLISEKLNVTTGDLIRFLKKNGYKNFSDLHQASNNHRIVSIKYSGESDAYDLVNTGNTHIYAIEANDGSKIFCHNSSVKNEFGDVLTIKSDDDKIKDVLHNLFYDILNIEFNLWPWIRTLCKYGDMFLKLEISEKYGIVNVIPVSPYEMTREEGFDPQNPFRVKFKHEGLLSGQLEYENYEIAHFRLVNDHNFLPYGKCLSQNTHIDTEYGSKFISDIKKGDKVWTFNIENRKFELSEVLNSVCSGKKDILRISTPHNFIDASYDHPVLVYDNNEFKYIKAHNIKMDQLLVISTGKMKFNRDIVINKKYIQSLDGPKVDLSPLECVPDIVDNEFAEFCGFMLGDGWLCKYQYNYGINISLGVDEYLNDRYISILEKYSGKKCNIQKFKGKSRTATIYSKLLHTILNNMGISGNAHTKRIPEWVFELSNDKKMSFIIGLTNADGSSFTDKWATRYGIWLCNKKLIFDFKKLIQTLNIKSSIPTHKYNNTEIEICGEKCNSTETHHFNYYLEGKEKTQIKKYNILNLDDDSNFILEPVRKIERMKNEKTYDIQVNTKNSNFIANGIIVHNSMVESARRVWKQLWLMQDAMLIHRIMRAPEKRIFKIDTGNIAPNETEQYIKNVVNKIKKVPYVDPRTGEYNLKYNMMNMTEDFFIPVRGGDSGTNIESLPGLEYNAIEDIEYLKNMMMAALKIPKAFLGYDEGISGKATLASEDVRFARTIERIQKIFISELSKIAVIHLYSQGFKNEDIVNFELSLTNPSTIYEQEKISLWQEKVSLIRDMKEIRMLSDDWIYENVLNLSNDEREKQKKLVLDDVKREFRYEQITAEGNDPFVTHQTFGTPHDLVALQKGRTSESDKNIDFGQTNFKMNWDDSTGKEDNITDSKDYDKNYNDTKRQKPASKYKQDSHIRGRDPIGSDEYHNSVNTTNKRKSGSVFDGINKTQLNNMLTEMSKNKNIILESLKIDNESCENDENENSDDNTYLNENNLLK